MLSAMEKPEVVRDYLSKECAEGRVLGPLSPEAFLNVQISRIQQGNGTLLLTYQHQRK